MSLALPAGPGGPATGSAIQEALVYLSDQVGEDGCVHGFGTCSPALTDWTVIAVASAGIDPRQWPEGGTSPVEHLREHPESDSSDLGSEAAWRARRLLAVVAAGEDPRSFGGVDHVQELRETFSGQFGDPRYINDDIFAVLALRAAGIASDDAMVASAVNGIRSAQAGDGGWSWCVQSHPSISCEVSTDMTGVAIQALSSTGAGAGDQDIAEALGFLEDQRVTAGDGRGCLTELKDGDEGDLDSTAWATMALSSLKLDTRQAPWAVDGASPTDCLLAHQADDGSFPPNTYTTTQVLATLAGVPHGRAITPLDLPPAAAYVRGQAQVDQPVTLEAPHAHAASFWIEGVGFLQGTQVSFTPETAGERRVELLTFDEHGRANGSLAFLQVHQKEGEPTGPDENPARGDRPDPPSAQLQAPVDAERSVPTLVTVHAQPADTDVVGYRVDWGDGTRTGWQDDAIFQHAYRSLGEHTLQAWAKDADGDVSQAATATLQVVDAGPRLALDGPAQVHRQAPVELKADATDPDGPAPNVTWSWPGGQANGTEVTIHLAKPGTAAVEVTATDQAGNTATAVHHILAINRPPRIEAVGPLTAEANTTHVLTAEVADPEGDPLTVTWQDGNTTTYGGQHHLATGPPGQRTLQLNVTDPYGGWANATVTVEVAEDPEEAETETPVIHRGQSPPDEVSEEGSDPGDEEEERPVVELPAEVHGQAGMATLLEGTAEDPDGAVTAVQVVLDRTVAVRGTERFQALLPPLDPGSYTVSARAANGTGWGPWTETTLIVEAPEEDQATGPHEPLTQLGGPDSEPANQAPGPGFATLAILAGAALMARRWEPW